MKLLSNRQYFRMRLNCLGKEQLVNIKWKIGQVQHTVQEDATSCGVCPTGIFKYLLQGHKYDIGGLSVTFNENTF